MSTPARVTQPLNRRRANVVLLLTAGLIVLSFIKASRKTYMQDFKVLVTQWYKQIPSLTVKVQTNISPNVSTLDRAKSDGKLSGTGDCKFDRNFMPEGSMPLILLLSFPGSGNTWVRFLIERSTGIYSGSRFNAVGTGDNDTSIWRKSNPCLKQTVIVKSHEWKDFDNPDGEPCQPEGAILLIRNPYGAILAEFNRRKSGKTGIAPTSKFKTQEWTNFAKSSAKEWSKSIQDELRMIQHVLIVFYENLVKNTQYELRRMLDFLQVAQNETRIACLLQNSTGYFKRVHKNFSFNPFSANINRTINQNIRKVRKFMKWNYNHTLPSY